MDTFANCIFGKDKREFEEILTEVTDDLQEFENELNVRKTTFFGGLYLSVPYFSPTSLFLSVYTSF